MPIKREPELPTGLTLVEAYHLQEPDLKGFTVTPEPAQETAGLRGNQSPITREILESFLACKTKAYLKLHGQQGVKSDYEALSTEMRAELRERASENLISRLKPKDVMRGVKITETVLESGAAIILDVTIECR